MTWRIPEIRKRFTEEQIVKILQEHTEGKTVGEVCRNNRISENERLSSHPHSGCQMVYMKLRQSIR